MSPRARHEAAAEAECRLAQGFAALERMGEPDAGSLDDCLRRAASEVQVLRLIREAVSAVAAAGLRGLGGTVYARPMLRRAIDWLRDTSSPDDFATEIENLARLEADATEGLSREEQLELEERDRAAREWRESGGPRRAARIAEALREAAA